MGGEGEMHYKWPLTGRVGRGGGVEKHLAPNATVFIFRFLTKNGFVKCLFLVWICKGKLDKYYARCLVIQDVHTRVRSVLTKIHKFKQGHQI